MVCALAVLLEGRNVGAHTCPPGAVSAMVILTVTALKADGTPVQPGIGVTAGESVFFEMSLSYCDCDPSGNIAAAFEGGTLLVTLPNGAVTNVTPPGGVPIIGPSEYDPTCPCNCGVVTDRLSVRTPYTTTPADAAAGSIVFTGLYNNPIVHLGTNDLLIPDHNSSAIEIRVNAPSTAPKLRISPADGLTVTGAGPGLYRIESTESLADPVSWTLMQEVEMTVEGFVIPIPFGDAVSQRFYRIVPAQ